MDENQRKKANVWRRIVLRKGTKNAIDERAVRKKENVACDQYAVHLEKVLCLRERGGPGRENTKLGKQRGLSEWLSVRVELHQGSILSYDL